MCIRRIKNLSRNKKIILLASLIIFLLILAGLTYYFWTKNYFSAQISQTKSGKAGSDAKLQQLVACPADGVWTTADKAFRHPLAISIENHPSSRPQSGLDKASLIYETPTEGGITRFLAVYVENDADEVGPVRSARTYFLDWLSEFDGIFAHCGGNADALALIKPDSIKDLDEFTYASTYWRSRDRQAPHNLYTSTDRLWTRAHNFGWDQKIDYASWKYKEDMEVKKRPQGGEVNILYANPSFKVKYNYSPSLNSYLRVINNESHLDETSGKQLSPKNVAVMWVFTWPLYDQENGWEIETISAGKAKIFLDGQVISGTWKKEGRTTRTKFYNEQGSEINFNRGQTWIQVVPEGTEVTY
jgi:hypothetical protein